MNLSYRTFRLQDAASCVRLLEIYPEYTPGLLGQLPLLWKRLLGDQAMIAAVVEDRGSIVGMGATVFVSDAFMREARAGLEPFLIPRLIEREMEGKSSPILRRNQIARANAGEGLNGIILHSPALQAPAPDHYAIRICLKDSFIWAHRGYRIREGLQEVWDETELQWIRAFQHLRSDFAAYYEKPGRQIPAHRPYLYGVTAEETLANPSSLAAPVFLYNPPRFQFPRGAQDLLAGALDGETDNALAEALHVSLAAVKMRWRQIYERVEAVAPELFPESEDRLSEQGRGREKRRHIVEYVRNHPEELRPFAPAGRSAAMAGDQA